MKQHILNLRNKNIETNQQINALYIDLKQFEDKAKYL